MSAAASTRRPWCCEELAPQVKGKNVTYICQTKVDTQFLQKKAEKYDFWSFRSKMAVSWEKDGLVGQFILRSFPTGRTSV